MQIVIANLHTRQACPSAWHKYDGHLGNTRIYKKQYLERGGIANEAIVFLPIHKRWIA